MQRLTRRLSSALPTVELRLAAGLRSALTEGYGPPQFRADLLAGLSVGIVALPLSMALAIACGVPPQYGLYTAIIGGLVVGLLGGSRFQVSGPTAAFVVVLAPLTAQYGLPGLLIATLLAGVMLILLGLLRMGRLIQYIPDPVVTGFTAGIAVVIATYQLRDLLGVSYPAPALHYWDHWAALLRAWPATSLIELSLGLGTLAVLLLWPRLLPRVPAPLPALVLAGLAAWLLQERGGIDLHTLGSAFSYTGRDGAILPGIPPLPPAFAWPWRVGGAELSLDYELLRALLPPAFAIAMLGAIESLLSAVIADGMTGTSHDPDGELVALGLGNLVGPFFGAFALTGALARTATNIRAGARSPLASAVHGVFILLAILLLAPLLAYLPLAAFAALLLVVAWNMSDAKHFAHILRVAPKSDVAVMLACFALTVLFDMVVAVTAGLMLAGLLFIRRMAEVSGAGFLDSTHPSLRQPLPPGVLLYEVNGPLFFGAAGKAMAALTDIGTTARAVILDVAKVPAIDATGIVNLESALGRLQDRGIAVIVSGLQEQPERSLRRAGLLSETERLRFAPDRLSAKRVAAEMVGQAAGDSVQ